MYYKELLFNHFGTSAMALGTSDIQTKASSESESEPEEYPVYSNLLGQATFVWYENTKRWNLKPRRLVILSIKQLADELTNAWDYNAGSNPTTYDPPYLLHVGQDRENPEGNCYKYHLKIAETPCTGWDQCSKNEEDRIEAERQQKVQKRGRPLRKRAEKKKPGRSKQ